MIKHIHYGTTIYFNKLIEGGDFIGRKNKVTFRYHNPNTVDETLKHVAKIFIEASRVKFENILRETAVQTDINEGMRESPAS